MEIKECKATEDDTSNDLMNWETRRQYGMLGVRKVQVWTNDAKHLSDIDQKKIVKKNIIIFFTENISKHLLLTFDIKFEW